MLSLKFKLNKTAAAGSISIVMKAGGIAFSVLIAAVSFGTGLFAGKKISARDHSATPRQATISSTLPPVKAQPRKRTTDSADPASSRITAADAPARLEELLKKPMRKRYEAMTDFVK